MNENERTVDAGTELEEAGKGSGGGGSFGTDRLREMSIPDRLRGMSVPVRIALAAAFATLAWWLLWLVDPRLGFDVSKPPKPYVYTKWTASNGVVLHTIRTSPDNVELKAIAANVTDTGETGINGGFFWNGDLLSIAIVNDKPLKGAPGDYGSGWYNTDVPRGTIVWDEAVRRFSVQVVMDASDIAVTDKQRYWAQGGVSMKLGDDAGWALQAAAEQMPAPDEARLRSGLAYDADGELWMIVTPSACTIEQFRDAVKQKIAPGKLVDGIFLDGDGSSQLSAGRAKLAGDTREVYQMLAVKEQ